MSRNCFICNNSTFDYKNHQTDLNTEKLSPVCDDCGAFELNYCQECKKINKSEELRHNIEGKNLCVTCLPKGSNICKDCDLLALFKCSCKFFFCKFCAEKHFVEIYNKNLDNFRSGRFTIHHFTSYPSLKTPNSPKNYFAPDFRSFFLSKFTKQINQHSNLSNILQPIERMCDYYKQSIKILEQIGDNDLKISKIYFASGYYVKFSEFYLKVINSPKKPQKPESWLKYAPFYYEENKNDSVKKFFQDSISSNENLFTSKIIKKLLLAWSSYSKKNTIKKLGKFIRKNQFIQASKEKMMIFTLAGLITKRLETLENIIDHLNFYYQEIPEHSLLYLRLSELSQNSENFLRISFQVSVRYSGYDNLSFIKIALFYFSSQKAEAENMFLNLFEETYMASDPGCLSFLSTYINTFISDSKTQKHLNSLLKHN